MNAQNTHILKSITLTISPNPSFEAYLLGINILLVITLIAQFIYWSGLSL